MNNDHNQFNSISINNSFTKSSLGIRGRLIIGFSIIIIIFLAASVITLFSVNYANNSTNHVIHSELPTYDAVLDLNIATFDSQIIIQDMMNLSDLKNKQQSFEEVWGNINRIESNIDDLEKSWKNNEYHKTWQLIKVHLQQLKSIQFQVIDFLNKNDKASAEKLLNSDLKSTLSKLIIILNTIKQDSNSQGFLDQLSQNLNSGAEKIVYNLNNIQVTVYTFSIIAIIVSIIVAMITVKTILRHIRLFREHSSRIASGDLTQSIKIDSSDEMGQLGNDLNIMTQSLASIAKEITLSCHNMVSSLEEVRHAIDAQSSGASEQASSINEITASLSEIEKSSSQTMDKAKSLGEIAEKTREKGQLGLEAIDQSVNGMKDVREKVQMIAQTILDLSNQTQQVGEITAVVNNLAQQSKMLALNASIEAAKAGEAGKGFAVVAVEVKNLAEQSEQATTQVQKILEDIRHAAEKAVMVTEEGTKGVDHGTNLVEQTGDIIKKLNDVIHETTIASQQIESAVRQEGAGIEQITTGMNEINQVTTSFVESVKQTTEAISNLATIAKNLKAYVDTYKL